MQEYLHLFAHNRTWAEAMRTNDAGYFGPLRHAKAISGQLVQVPPSLHSAQGGVNRGE